MTARPNLGRRLYDLDALFPPSSRRRVPGFRSGLRRRPPLGDHGCCGRRGRLLELSQPRGLRRHLGVVPPRILFRHRFVRRERRRQLQHTRGQRRRLRCATLRRLRRRALGALGTCLPRRRSLATNWIL